MNMVKDLQAKSAELAEKHKKKKKKKPHKSKRAINRLAAENSSLNSSDKDGKTITIQINHKK